MSTRFGAAQMNIKRLEADIKNLQDKMAKDSTERVDLLNANLMLETEMVKLRLSTQSKARQVDTLQGEMTEMKTELTSRSQWWWLLFSVLRAERNQLKADLTQNQEKMDKMHV